MAVVKRRNVKEYVVSPCGRLIKLKDRTINCLKNLPYIIAILPDAVHMHHNKLNGSIACTLPHTIYCSIDEQIALCNILSVDHADAVSITHLKIVVRMVAKTDLRTQIGI